MLDDTELQRMLDDIGAPESLAAEAYGSAWEPGDTPTDALDAAIEGAPLQRSISPEALTRIRVNEEKVAGAKTAEDRAQARKELDVYRLTLIFGGDEADIVRRVLGSTGAQQILAYCQQIAGAAATG